MDEARLVKERTDIKGVMENYGVIFGRNRYAICPFHNEKTASLSVRNGRYKCFGCGKSGDVIDFVMDYFGLDFRQALLKLDTDFSLHVFSERPMTHKERKKAREQEQLIKNYYRWKNERRSEIEERIETLSSVMRKLEFLLLTSDDKRLLELESSLISELGKLEKEIQWITK
jgi:DNA primase (bacterial type)